MFGNSTIGFLLLITHILACLTVGFLFRFWKISSHQSQNFKKYSNYKKVDFSSLGEIIAQSISNAISTILMIGGFVVLFSVIISIFKASHLINLLILIVSPFFKFLHIPINFIAPIITGLLEITNGINLISAIHIKKISINIVVTAFLLGLGGISIFLQVLSITSKTDLSIKPYIIGKILQGFIAAFYTFIFINIFPIFNFNL